MTRNAYWKRIPGTGRTDPGVPSRWLFHYHPEMTAEPLLRATPVHGMTIGEDFMRDHVHTWGPDLISFPLFSPVFCQLLIDASDALGVWGPAAGDDYGGPILEIDRIVPRLSDVVTQIVGRHVNPLLRRVFLGMHTMAKLETPRLSRLDAGPVAEDAEGIRIERGGNVSFSIALNTDYEGGGLRFPRQQAVVSDLPVGHAVMIPSGPSHLYEVIPVTSGVQRTLVFKTRSEDDD